MLIQSKTLIDASLYVFEQSPIIILLLPLCDIIMFLPEVVRIPHFGPTPHQKLIILLFFLALHPIQSYHYHWLLFRQPLNIREWFEWDWSSRCRFSIRAVLEGMMLEFILHSTHVLSVSVLHSPAIKCDSSCIKIWDSCILLMPFFFQNLHEFMTRLCINCLP